jgi:flagellar biosynthesis protein FlhB
MNKVLVIMFGMGIIALVVTTAIMIRPGYMKFREAFNNTITRMDDESTTQIWENLLSTADYGFWIVPIVAVIIVIGWIYMSMQQKEYQTAGYYR